MADTALTKVDGKVHRNPLVGSLVGGRYRVLELLARGGMGAIYRAEQESVGRTVALKVLDIPAPHSDEMDFAKRFMLEASVVAKLRHPNTVTVYDYGEAEDGVYFMAMELLEGLTLREELAKNGPLSPRKTIQFAKQICGSLREAHRCGVIHRDLKPANIFVNKRPGEDDFVKVLDFGLVKRLDETATQITAAGAFLGSPRYMAPEQILCAAVDMRTDIYSLGIVMFEMLAGRSPFDRETAASTMLAQIEQVAPMISEVSPGVEVPAELENIVQRCMAKKRDHRFANMDELLRALEWLDTPATSASVMITSGIVPRAQPTTPSVQPATFSRVAAGSGFREAAKGALLTLGVLAGVLAAVNPWDSGKSQPVGSNVADVPVPLVQPTEIAPLENVSVPEGKVVVTLQSTPKGATVTVGQQSYGPTPVHIVLSGEDAVIGRAIEFHFSRPGYLPHTVLRRIDAQKIVVDSGVMRPISGNGTSAR